MEQARAAIFSPLVSDFAAFTADDQVAAAASRRRARWRLQRATGQGARWTDYLWGLATTLLCTALTFPFADHVDLINIVMIYLLCSAAAALWFGRGPSALTAIANVVAFDFFMVPPRFSLTVYDVSYLLTFGAMLLISLLMTHLVGAVCAQREVANSRERHARAMFAITEDLSNTCEPLSIARISVQQIAQAIHGSALLLLCHAGRVGDKPAAMYGDRALPFDGVVARRVVATGREAGFDSNADADTTAYVPLIHAGETVGVLVVGRVADGGLTPERQRLLSGLARQVTMALERVRLMQTAQQAQLTAKGAAMRNTLLASISHDLRTPLSAIASAGGFVAQTEFPLDPHRRLTLGRLIESKARDMSDLLSNVLDLVKLEAGDDVVNRDWHIVGDIVGLAIQRNEARLSGWHLRTAIADDLPMVSIDATLFVQLLSNLLENATKYTPPGTQISISADRRGSMMRLAVEDNGPGWGGEDPERLFEKFSRGKTQCPATGVGLGLTICRVIAHLHGGEIRAMSSRAGGARFEVEVPAPMEDARMEVVAAEL